MALQCNISLNVPLTVAGQSPAPMATLTVYNPNASAVAVTAIQMQFFDGETGLPINGAVAQMTPAYGPGQVVVAPALSSITFGPMPVAVGSASSMNPFPQNGFSSGAVPVNPQMGQPPQTYVLVGATVYGSDGSANDAGRAGLFVSYVPAPPRGFQGGDLQFAVGSNLITGVAVGA